MLEKGSRILIADDFELIRFMIEKALRSLGYMDISEVESGTEAMAALDQAAKESRPFGGLFLDWNMPEMDGLAVLKACRADERFKTMPIFMVTAESEKAFMDEAIKAGVSDYILKPFTTDTIKEKILKFRGE